MFVPPFLRIIMRIKAFIESPENSQTSFSLMAFSKSFCRFQ